MRSFRSALALRIAAHTLVMTVAGVAASGVLFRQDLLAGVDASLLEIAQIVANAGADRLSPEDRFPEGVLHPEGQVAIGKRAPRVQLLSAAGLPVARSDSSLGSLSVPAEAFDQARRGQPGFATHASDAGPVRSVIYPLEQIGSAHQGHFLQVTLSLAGLRRATIEFLGRMSLLALGAVALAAFLSWRTAGKALEPALALTSAVESIAVSELGTRVSSPGNLLEFQRMTVAFNGLLARIEHAVTGIRRFTSDASHELRAPLTVLRGEMELALTRPRTPQEYEDVLRRCLDEVLRLTRLADDLLTLTRVEGGVLGGKRGPVDFDDVVERAAARKAGVASARGVTLDLSGTSGTVAGDVDVLLRAVDGLIEHAIMASPRGGTVRIRMTDGEKPAVTVADSGPGLKSHDISGVFQRFYRSNQPRARSEESGLGLSIARAVALSHGGSLEYSGNDPGASFTLTLPAAS